MRSPSYTDTWADFGCEYSNPIKALGHMFSGGLQLTIESPNLMPPLQPATESYLQQLLAEGDGYGFGAVGCADLGQNRVDVPVHAVVADS